MSGTELDATIGITKKMFTEKLSYGCNSAIDITANPQIENGYNGQLLTIIGKHDTNTLKLDDGDGLVLAGGASFTLGEGDVIVLMYLTGTGWVEVSRSNN